MTNYGTLAKKLKRMDNKDLPLLTHKKGNLIRESSVHLEGKSANSGL